MYIDLPGCLSLQFTTQLQIYTNSHLPATQQKLLNIILLSPKYFPDGCFVVYRLLLAFFSVNSKLVRPFRSFSVPFRSLFGPFRFFFGPFRSFSVLFGPFRSFSVFRPTRPSLLFEENGINLCRKPIAWVDYSSFNLQFTAKL